jgi:S-adenosylmethionine:tRNA ribosyltransferase-isomerase
MKTTELQYELPPELIAQRPAAPRDSARLLVLHRATGRIEHRVFRDLPGYLDRRDCLVINRTKVIAARFAARRATGGRIDGLFVTQRSAGQWQVLLDGAGRLRPGERLTLLGKDGKSVSSWTIEFLNHVGDGLCEVHVAPADSAENVLAQTGHMPLPPYIKRDDDESATLDALDRTEYQTVFASQTGAVAAPTAGLHFTPEMLESLRKRGNQIAELVLHVGMGTFAPIKVERLADHQMHREWYDLPRQSTATIESALAGGGKIIAVGTTSVRVLETCSRTGPLVAGSGWTDLLIYPPYSFRATDALVTNFHLPGSTLLALVFAYAGKELVRDAYESAIRERYRFYSYGDAMLIL